MQHQPKHQPQHQPQHQHHHREIKWLPVFSLIDLHLWPLLWSLKYGLCFHISAFKRALFHCDQCIVYVKVSCPSFPFSFKNCVIEKNPFVTQASILCKISLHLQVCNKRNIYFSSEGLSMKPNLQVLRPLKKWSLATWIPQVKLLFSSLVMIPSYLVTSSRGTIFNQLGWGICCRFINVEHWC